MKSAATNRALSEKDCFAKLQAIQQLHLLKNWSMLSEEQKKQLQLQITHLDIDFFHKQQELIRVGPEKLPPYEAPKTLFFSGNTHDWHQGKDLVQNGHGAVLVLAGGQGSRLNFSAPKGCFEITAIKKKSLFQFLCEKVKAASNDVGRPLQMGIMTSPLNHEATCSFFAQNHFFGLETSQISFFQQEMWPLLTLEGDLYLEQPDLIACGPNGNGGVFRRFVESGLWDKWEKAGVEQVNVIPIDNPLADPFDYELFGFQSRSGVDVVVKTARKRNAEEHVGVLTEVGGKIHVVEYFEMSPEDRRKRNDEGGLQYGVANLGLYCATMPWIRQVSRMRLPLHVTKKVGGWKFEEFIFDLLPFATQSSILIYPREACFAPLKNLTGEDSIQNVRKALLKNDAALFEKLSGSTVPSDIIFELSPQFYYPTPQLLEKWKGRPFPKEGYLDE